MKAIKVVSHLVIAWGWIIPGFFALWSCQILIEDGVPDLLHGENRQFDFDFVAPVYQWIWVTLIWSVFSSILSSYLMWRNASNRPRPNKTDAGNGSKAICRVSNVLRSPSPDPRRSPNFNHAASLSIIRKRVDLGRSIRDRGCF